MVPDSIALQGDEAQAAQYIPRAQKMLQGLRNRLAGSGATTASTNLRLSDTVYAYARIGPGIARAVIVATGSPDVLQEPPESETPDVPDFLSGVVVNSVLKDGAVQLFLPTEQTRRDHGIADGPSARLAVTADPDIEARWKPSHPLVIAQSERAVPTMYTGRMRQVVQLLLGFGKEPDRSRYDRTAPRQWVHKRAGAVQVLSSWEISVKQRGRQVPYDWSHYRTHGVTVASDGRLWLVEVGILNGVIAMPLPLNAATTTDAFRAKLIRMGDEAGLDALDALGGWPTGEPMPGGRALTQAIRAGLVLQLVTPEQITEFYQHDAYSSANGWSFSTDGADVHNTAWTIEESSRLKVGVWYAIRITIGDSDASDPPALAGAVQARIAAAQVDADELVWLRRKAERLTDTQCAEVLEANTQDEALQVLRAFVLNAVATASASMRLQGRGYIYKGGRWQNLMQFAEPDLDACLTFDMNADGDPAFFPRCDTVMWVAHHGNALQTIRYFFDPRTNSSRIESDFETCMNQGAWQQSILTGPIGVPQQMYTNAIDHRAEVPASSIVTRITGTSMGYRSVATADDLMQPYLGMLSRTKVFRRPVAPS
ncbi:MAG: hypothetical protein E6Q97_03830 [Desulfurellales bacterium]|nr:MAG: hypothetical protein E6Q97_03830 [Desulfurellales bacterium]